MKMVHESISDQDLVAIFHSFFAFRILLARYLFSILFIFKGDLIADLKRLSLCFFLMSGLNRINLFLFIINLLVSVSK